MVKEGIKTLRRENNKNCGGGKKGRGVSKTLCVKGRLAFFDYFNRIFNLIFLQLF